MLDGCPGITNRGAGEVIDPALIVQFFNSHLGKRICRLKVHREVPFTFPYLPMKFIRIGKAKMNVFLSKGLLTVCLKMKMGLVLLIINRME